jgi:hypothetical protein
MSLTDIHKTVITNIKAMLYNSSLLSYKVSVPTQELTLEVVADDVIPTSTQIRFSDVTPFTPGYIVEVGDYVILRLDAFLIDVISRLESFGYTVTDADSWMIGFAVQKVESSIKNECNVTLIPDGIYYTAVDMACGETLFTKKQSGKLEGFNLDAALKSVQAGDTTVTFAVGSGSMTPEQRLDSLLSYLMSNGRGEFACYRKIKW